MKLVLMCDVAKTDNSFPTEESAFKDIMEIV